MSIFGFLRISKSRGKSARVRDESAKPAFGEESALALSGTLSEKFLGAHRPTQAVPWETSSHAFFKIATMEILCSDMRARKGTANLPRSRRENTPR